MGNNQNNQLSSREQYELSRQEKLKKQNSVAKNQSLKRGVKIAAIILVVSGGLGGVIWYFVAHPPQPRTNREVALTCTTDMATKFHIHPHLEIVVNGRREEILANIGIKLTCMNALHTHDTSGVIHVESPEHRDFTLSDFFAVWNKPFNKDQILDYKADSRHAIRETVNGKDVLDYENTVLRDKDQIIIIYQEIK